jgi:two-component system heavy metal sensor histidine kinase CusS
VLNRLQSSLNNLSEFAGDLARDLRTPLNNLMVQTEVVLSQPRENRGISKPAFI